MKRKMVLAAVWAVCLMLLGNIAYAKGEDSLTTVSDVLFAIEEKNGFLSNQISTIDSEDAKTVFQGVEDILHTAQVVLTSFQQQNSELQINRMNDTTYSLETPIVQLNDADYFVSEDILYRPQYLRISNSVYGADNTYLGTTRVEIGTRDDTSIILMVDYDNVYNMTGRFAVKVTADAADVIYTKTLGMNMDIVLNVSNWQAGEEIESWDKDLLLPIQ